MYREEAVVAAIEAEEDSAEGSAEVDEAGVIEVEVVDEVCTRTELCNDDDCN